MQSLAKNEALPIITGACDFYSWSMDDCFANRGGVAFTSYALTCVPMLDDGLIDYMERIHPDCVIHFEPCYEHFAEDSLYGLLCRKYIEVNNYNQNLVQVLHRAENFGRIKIVEERKCVFGNNPFLPISILVWKPLD